ncbi:MAG: HAMP domain-containing histidine kinase [Deltaproteobacteria bacterium]|nr:HAMP domain-containing histidine kinase [Deltaproteobacteria bacterium]
MFKSLYSRLAAVLAGLFFLVGLGFVAFTVFSTGMYNQEVNQKLNARLAEQIVKEKLLMENNRINRTALDEIFHMLMVINPAIEVYLLDPQGRILAFSAPREKIKRKGIDLVPVQKWIEDRPKIPILGDDPRSLNGKKVFSAARIPEKGPLEGYLYVILGGESYDSVLQKMKGSYILQLSAWMILAGLMFALIAGLIIFGFMTGRLRRLASAMDTFRKSQHIDTLNFPDEKEIDPADEIDLLTASFNQMAERIQTQMDQLKASDNTRREMVANVSHDLRTPLATLRGYVETLLLKEKDLSTEKRRYYLEIAIKHCERLSKLVDELMELAKLESLETEVQKESFHLGELAQDVIQKFRLRAEEKEITLKTDIEKDMPLTHADIGLIERVLENLLENAINYTPEGGAVGLSIKLENDEISVAVSDTGTGIPEAEIPQIFERFYRMNRGRGQGGGHHGLGLAIAKRILELHQRSIHVKSLLNCGTTLSFSLPAFPMEGI